MGENMNSVLEGKVSPLELMMQNNMLSGVYEDGLGCVSINEQLATVVCQIAHRYPHMNILEIGKSL
jgi:hybrid polyketide synthase/nonribosomal peptide synthetase ACE1